MENIIEIHNLYKSYGKINAVDNLSLSLKKGCFFSLLGENGAGKSTTVNILSTLLSPDSGKINICGLTLGKNDHNIREKIGIVFQKNMLDGLLTVKENLLLRGSLYGLTKNALEEKLINIGRSLEIEDIFHRRYGELSGGQKRKSDIARALMGNPEILFLDEPTTGLDPSIRKSVWESIDALNSLGITVFLTTHYMEEASKSDHIAIISKGRLIAEGTPDSLKEKHSKERVRIKSSLPEKIAEYFNENNILYSRNLDYIEFFPDNPEKMLNLLYPVKENIDNLEIIKASLDEVFLNVINDGGENK